MHVGFIYYENQLVGIGKRVKGMPWILVKDSTYILWYYLEVYDEGSTTLVYGGL